MLWNKEISANAEENDGKSEENDEEGDLEPRL